MLHHNLSMLHYPIISAAFGVIFATGVIVDENSLVPIGTLGAVCAFVWWIGRKLQRIDDRLEGIEKQYEKLEQTADKVASLPCTTTGKVCDETKPLRMK